MQSPNPSATKSLKKGEKRGFGLGLRADTKITCSQLLSMKECSRKKVSVGPGGQRDQEHGVVLHVQGECYQPPITSRKKILSITPPTHPGGQLDQVVNWTRWTARSRTWGSSM